MAKKNLLLADLKSINTIENQTDYNEIISIVKDIKDISPIIILALRKDDIERAIMFLLASCRRRPDDFVQLSLNLLS